MCRSKATGGRRCGRRGDAKAAPSRPDTAVADQVSVSAPQPPTDDFWYAHGELLHEMQHPETAAGLCEHANGLYVHHLNIEHGATAALIDVRHRESGYAHTVAVADGHIIDWSARQFGRNRDMPEVYAEAAFFAQWQPVSQPYPPEIDEADPF